MSLLHRLFEKKLNFLLVRDPDYFEHLAPLAGKVMGFEIRDLGLEIYLLFHHTYIEVKPDYVEPQLRLWGRSIDFAKFLFLKEARPALLQSQRVDFAGDLMLLENLESWLALDIQFDFLKKILKNRIAYLQEERACLVSPILYQDFVERLLLLQEGLDRCEARLAGLTDIASRQ